MFHTLHQLIALWSDEMSVLNDFSPPGIACGVHASRSWAQLCRDHDRNGSFTDAIFVSCESERMTHCRSYMPCRVYCANLSSVEGVRSMLLLIHQHWLGYFTLIIGIGLTVSANVLDTKLIFLRQSILLILLCTATSTVMTTLSLSVTVSIQKGVFSSW